jgi:hypothetical protein
MTDATRIVVTIAFFMLMVVSTVGGVIVMRTCHRAFRAWGMGRVGRHLSKSTGWLALSSVTELAGWIIMVIAREPHIGVSLVLIGGLLGVFSIVHARRGYDALYELYRLGDGNAC